MVSRVSLIGLLVAVVAVVASAPAEARTSPSKRCRPRASQVVARHGSEVLFLRNTSPDDGEYGAPSALFVCPAAKRSPHRLVDFPDGDSPGFAPLGAGRAKARFSGRYVAFSFTYDDIVCSKYQQDNCAYSLTGSFDVKTGRRRALAADPAPGTRNGYQGYTAADLALTRAGWFAWVPSGMNPPPLLGVDGTGQRTLDPGPIDAGSLSASGTNVSWTTAGQSHSATLR